MEIKSIDHIVLTVTDIDKTVAFYCDVLNLKKITFGKNRVALIFGNQKINLHKKGEEFEPKANLPTPGSVDLCFIAETNIINVLNELKEKKIDIIEGIVERTGAIGNIKSIYIRDPDKNLIEISNYS
ncbi:catechol 2,3-dioxygenase-like lactoylglutathione lyase family enzyme [Chitinophaga dinghuensis]|uniref:Catechol 2,3-dioxygenase-like lactoylglutathione lyase family enzyme n=1 Tax=Chitinophaga dinghuensis TaxID=1539050 RepID=A0A327VT78_9BACT|nr:VOC family protein [Chitinophaga dinghuensis]RAJ77614.1 catechol 2,3-dioxygenase-like lactoylglutathione lyase family enzyme [Chitinophaga dinghuensis]